MKRKKSITTDLRSFLQRAATKKKQSLAIDESCMQLVVYQGQQNDNVTGTSTIPPEPEVTAERNVIEEDEIVPLNKSNSSDEGIGDMYQIQNDPRLRVPISSYDVNDQDSVRRAYICIGAMSTQNEEK